MWLALALLAQDGWMTSLEDGRAAARKQDRPVLVYTYNY